MSKWYSTYSFRRFREKHTDLSKLYWTSAVAFEVLEGVVKSLPPDKLVIEGLPAVTFKKTMLPEKPQEMLAVTR